MFWSTNHLLWFSSKQWEQKQHSSNHWFIYSVKRDHPKYYTKQQILQSKALFIVLYSPSVLPQHNVWYQSRSRFQKCAVITYTIYHKANKVQKEKCSLWLKKNHHKLCALYCYRYYLNLNEATAVHFNLL